MVPTFISDIGKQGPWKICRGAVGSEEVKIDDHVQGVMMNGTAVLHYLELIYLRRTIILVFQV